jgi:hypothetical protein
VLCAAICVNSAVLCCVWCIGCSLLCNAVNEAGDVCCAEQLAAAHLSVLSLFLQPPAQLQVGPPLRIGDREGHAWMGGGNREGGKKDTEEGGRVTSRERSDDFKIHLNNLEIKCINKWSAFSVCYSYRERVCVRA